MIGFFPDPYPDELFYSICARFANRIGYPYRTHVSRELLGSSRAAVIDLPCHLDHLISVLPQGHQYTVERLINENTLLPFYVPFLPAERVDRIQHSMRGSNNPSAHMCIGIAYKNTLLPNWLRFCPLCAEEDRRKFGETYWHRLHQLTNIGVCSVHQTFLVDSQVRARNRKIDNEFISANEVVEEKVPQAIDLSNHEDKIIIRIANDVAWLLNQSRKLFDYKKLQLRYLKLLCESKLIRANGNIASKALTLSFLNYYSNSLLSKLGCLIKEEAATNWISRLIINLKDDSTTHPLRHLLLIQFLGNTAEEFFASSTNISLSLKPFGSGPWPCLDPTSSHFRQLVIKECKINSCKPDNRPAGIFHCPCGSSYYRKGPDLSTADKFRFERFLSYSQSWDTTLMNLWKDSSVSVCEIGRRLGVTSSTIKHRATFLGLSFPRLGLYKATQASTELISKLKVSQAFQEKLSANRKNWLCIREENPAATRRELQKRIARPLYRWLYKHDSVWLEDHMPQKKEILNCRHSTLHSRLKSSLRKGGAVQSKMDWESKDIQLAKEVKIVANKLKNASDPPVRVTVKAIGLALDQVSLFKKRRHKVPLTAQILTEVVETFEDFAIRKLQWAADYFRKQKMCPTRWKLLKKAGIDHSRLLNSSQVQDAIDAALQTLASVDTASDVASRLETLAIDNN